MKERVKWIDSAKGILMIMVILGHSLAETSYKSPFYHGYLLVFRLITLFHMPAFFIITGYLMANREWKTIPAVIYLKRKLVKLMIPYLIFEGIAIVLLVFVLRFKSFKKAMIDTLCLKCNLRADWFLVTMFFAACLFFFIVRSIDSKRLLLIVAVLSIVMACICNRESHIQILIGRSLLALCFMVIGYLWGDERYIAIINKPLYLTLIMLAMLAIAIFNGPVSMYDISMGNLKTMFVLGAILGTILIVCASKKRTSRVFEKIGLNSLVIMGVHQHIVYVARSLNLSIYGLIPTMALFASMLAYSLTIVEGYSYIRSVSGRRD